MEATGIVANGAPASRPHVLHMVQNDTSTMAEPNPVKTKAGSLLSVSYYVSKHDSLSFNTSLLGSYRESKPHSLIVSNESNRHCTTLRSQCSNQKISYVGTSVNGKSTVVYIDRSISFLVYQPGLKSPVTPRTMWPRISPTPKTKKGRQSKSMPSSNDALSERQPRDVWPGAGCTVSTTSAAHRKSSITCEQHELLKHPEAACAKHRAPACGNEAKETHVRSTAIPHQQPTVLRITPVGAGEPPGRDPMLAARR